MSTQKKPKVVAVVGPTAAGKTGLTIELATKFNGEVISADSRQIYRGLDIGTAKVTSEETKGIPHHLIDIVDINTVYTAHDFLRDADAAVTAITKRNKVPFVTGGTFFYIELLRRRMEPAPVAPNHELRKELELISTEDLFAKLTTLDSRRAATIDRHNRRRLIRALEVVTELGSVPPTSHQTICPYDFLLLSVTRPKNELRERFASRAATWLEQGLLQEVEALLAQGTTSSRLQEFGFEYTLAYSLLTDEIDRNTFCERFVQKNWQYAKRQMTWLDRDPDINWIDPEDSGNAAAQVQDFLNKSETD